MPPKRRNIEASLQVGAANASQSSNVEFPPGKQKRQRREVPRYRFQKELSASPSPPPLDKASDEGGGGQAKEVATGVVSVEARPSILDAEESDYD